MGCGHDAGFGGFYDAKGDDNYVVESLSLGGGNANGISLFVDGAGNDGYIARNDNTLGYSDLRNWFGMIGVFLDLEGKDYYGTTRGRNDTLWTGSFYGAGLDANLKPTDEEVGTPEEKRAEKSKEEIDKELAEDIPTLFIQGSAAPQKYQYLVNPARDRLIARSDESIPYLLEMLNTEQPREAQELRDYVLPKLGSKVAQQLIDTVRLGAPGRVGLAMYVLGEMHDSSAALAIGKRLRDTNWRVRATAAEALMKIKSDTVKPFLRIALRDTVELVRARSARALVINADSAELVSMLPLLNDPSQIVRYQMQIGYQLRGIDSIAGFYSNALLNYQTGYAYPLLSALADSVHITYYREMIFDALTAHPDPTRRAKGVQLAINWRDDAMLRQAAAMKKSETNSQVLFLIYQAIELQKQTAGTIKEKSGSKKIDAKKTDAKKVDSTGDETGEKNSKKKKSR